MQNESDDVITEVTEAEFHAAVRTSLARLGLTYAELEDQARRRDFASAQAHSLWVSIGGAVRPELLPEQAAAVAQKATVPKVIGLDVSLTCTGVAGEGWTDTIRPRTGVRGHPRLAWIIERVTEHITGADLVVIEGPSFGGGVAHRHEDLAGLRVMVRHACWRRSIPYAVVPPSCRALYATGKGSGPKGAVRDAVRTRYGVDCDGPGRYDQADAYTLLAMGLHHLGWPLAVIPDTNRRGLDGCQWPTTEGLAA
ncbi:hypothetical protein EDD90_7364 [Streptomyces sp. Ag109_O5-1]|uniref:hypothetical protein n=1 Tax=Streptomyces sp. Ag109_O5-1 TaxID=1938851 RepID=UPI000F9B61B0|nr:hypothetical protein [Streptomyces sp. Ag109_O5-1]RPE44134.1 hypothetical protein EDD90_7364 [Streptomyces sp. Ag109_O5-1]